MHIQDVFQQTVHAIPGFQLRAEHRLCHGIVPQFQVIFQWHPDRFHLVFDSVQHLQPQLLIQQGCHHKLPTDRHLQSPWSCLFEWHGTRRRHEWLHEPAHFPGKRKIRWIHRQKSSHAAGFV